MWICLLALCTQLVPGIAAETNCPTNCSCLLGYDQSLDLMVDCDGNADFDHEQLSESLSVSSTNQTHGLRSLGITNTPLTYVPRSVCRLPTLKSLYLDRNRLTRLPGNCFVDLTNLVQFSAVQNAIEALQDGVFDGLTKLAELNLSSNRIVSIGSSVCHLPRLLVLLLNNNQLTKLPTCLSNLSNLITFDASNNRIETLQDDLFDGLIELQHLNLSCNNIGSVGLSVCRLTHLITLDLSGNRLTRLPDDCLTNLTNLEWLSASDNDIESLQDGLFDGLTKLRHLDLSRNNINSIGLWVFATSSNLSGLFHIDLSWNNITYLEPWVYDRMLIGSFERRTKVSLDNNNLSKFTNKMGHYTLCQNEIPFGLVNLTNSNIKYQMGIMNNWPVNITQSFNCYAINKNGNINLFMFVHPIICDCVDYQYYREAATRKQIGSKITRRVLCKLTDPLTRNTSIADAYSTDLSLFVCEITERCPVKCICVYRPANSTLHVYCSNRNLKALPPELPDLPDSNTKYKLDFSNNRLLRRLEHRDYFVNTSVLDVSNCGVDDIRGWEDIAKIPNVNLYGNKLTSLPPSFKSANITAKLNLANNPWDCSCDNKWMSYWLRYVADRLRSAEEIRCHNPSRLRGKKITNTSKVEFCVDPASEAASEAANEAVRRTLTISLTSFAGVVFLLLSAGVIVYRLRVKLYTRWNFHPFDRDECLGEDMDYDMFLCCSSEDTNPHGFRVLKLTESNGYRVFYHERDFFPGEFIVDNICHGIQRSKRTVCLLSENFLRSTYCMHEFQLAFHHNIVVKRKKRLIVLMMLDNPSDLLANDDPDKAVLRQFLRQYTYIDYTADDWLDKLLYALPLHGIFRQNEDPYPDVPLRQI